MFETLEPLAPELFWILCLAFLIAFLLAFSVGANDVSNSFGTSVGSRVLTVTQACILATFCEAAGATLLGYSVCDTFRRKMYDIKQYDGAQKELMLGALACLIGSAAWNIVATLLKMPISGTHSIVGATIGFSIVLRGWESVRWKDMLRIVASWFASPFLSGLISSLIYLLISKTIIRKVDPLRSGLKALPLFYGVTIFINVASVVIDGPDVFGLNTLPWYAGLFIALVCASIAICYVAMILVPKLRRQIMDEVIASKTRIRTMPPVPRGSLASVAPVQSGAADGGGYDNATFKQDETSLEQAPKIPPSKPKRELTLDPKQLMPSTDGEPPASGAGADAGAGADTTDPPATTSPRPTIAPKPAYLLRRQKAQDQSQLEEIDLSSPPTERDLELGVVQVHGAGTRTAKVQQQQQQHRHHHHQHPSAPPLRPEAPSQFGSAFGGERYEVSRLFSSLQILTACFASFAHGTNDVSNAVAPLIPIWNIYSTGKEDIQSETQIWILAFGSIGICAGLWAWGRAVMGTVADGLTKITPSKGFSIELGAAVSVLLATKLGLPISTTHCKVGSLVIVGLVSSKFLDRHHLLGLSEPPLALGQQASATDKQTDSPVDLKLFANIAITWIVTVPLAAAASAGVMMMLRLILL